MSERAPSATAPPRWVLPAILALAVALRLLAWHGAVVMTNDGPDFLWQAGRLLEGDGDAVLRHPYHPGYAAATALLALPLRDVLAAALAVSILSALAIVLAAHALAARAFPGRPWAAPAAALLAAVHGRLVITTSDIQSDGLFLALVALAFAALLAAADDAAARRAAAGRMLVAGLLTGLAYLVRPEGLFVIAAALLAGLAVLRGGPGGARVASAGLALFLAGVLVVALPYILALHDLTGDWGLSQKPSLAAAGLGATRQETPDDDGEDASTDAPPPGCPLASPKVYRAPPGATTAMPYVWNAPPTPAQASAPATKVTPEPASSPASASASALPPSSAPAPATASAPAPATALPPPATDAAATAIAEAAEAAVPAADPARTPLASAVRAGTVLLGALRVDTAVLALAGLALLRRSRPGLCAAALALLAGWLGVGTLHWSLGQSLSARHMLVATVLALPLAGGGLAWLAGVARDWARGPPAGAPASARGRRVAGAALGVLLGLSVLAHAAAGVRPRHAGSEARLAALEWARQHTAPGERLAVHRRKDSWYSGRPVLVVDLPCFDGELRDKLAQYGVALLVLDEQRVRRDAPHWLDDGPFTEAARFGEGDDAVLVLALAYS